MDQIGKAKAFKALHVKGRPLVLYNIWDAGSAGAVAKAGAPALATGSWSVAAAQGFADGEQLPLVAALRTAREIVQAVDVPVSVDFEGGYAEDPARVGENAVALIETGAVGLNMEDRIVGGKGLHAPDVQAARLAAIRARSDAAGVPFFINARTDVFFSGYEGDAVDLVPEAIARAKAYADAGADGVFLPGLDDLALIAQLCEAIDLPVNVMRLSEAHDIEEIAKTGVARISHGPAPYRAAMKALGAAAQALY
ncbi:isocitrate lyase/PEP mutase family protein [Sulfitobacter aestuariivivens]|uniref:Isocitrate lyase/phosphoenolpyruvate mutase family protein n=1 Tax=Sulfitobacter aestuariivivens TaxID=2766981 RepID=A0A927CZY4_9RHOB|nr:isocitrate lyase/phosphoenolpyruvate mutase family protein [Sulfitobacter aestuariivivens]MBD3662510.1 isocitrate lyase/phosphoenolpyruvate mutase family protein [Sulfitobacter aestuariivivens]